MHVFTHENLLNKTTLYPVPTSGFKKILFCTLKVKKHISETEIRQTVASLEKNQAVDVQFIVLHLDETEVQSCTGINIHMHSLFSVYSFSTKPPQVAYKSIPQASGSAQSKRSNTHTIYYLGLKIRFYFVTTGEHILRTDKMSGHRTVVPDLKPLNS